MSKSKDEAILRHGLALQRIFPKTKLCGGPVTLYKRLHRIEAEAHSFAERECNEQLPEGASERKDASILKRLDAILGFKAAGIPVFVNGDPRGYALKIDDAYVKEQGLEIYRDMGGYGIICPDF
jgi:hypothetical protein